MLFIFQNHSDEGGETFYFTFLAKTGTLELYCLTVVELQENNSGALFQY